MTLRPSRLSHRGWFFVLCGFVLLVSLVLLAFLLEAHAGRARLKAARKTLEAAGILQPVETLVPPPSEEALVNGEVLLALLRRLKAIGVSNQVYRIIPEGMQRVAPDAAVPLAALAAPQFFGTEKDRPPRSWEEFGDRLKDVAPMLEEARSMLRQPVAFDYDPAAAKPRFADDTGLLRELNGWLKAETIIRLHEHDIPGVLDDIEAIQTASMAIAATPSLVRRLFGMAMITLGTDNLFWEVLQEENLSAANLDRLQMLASQVDFIKEGTLSWKIQIATTHLGFGQIRGSLAKPITWSFIEEPEGILGEKPAIEVRNFLWSRLWADGDEARALADGGKSETLVQEFLSERNWSTMGSRLESSGTPVSDFDLWRFPFSSSLRANDLAHSLFKSMVRAEVRRQLVLAAIGIRKYQLATGRLPEGLAELTPAYLPAVPWDWFDGKPLKYRHTGDGFVLYSSGKNGVDDGGDAGKDFKKSAFESAPDYVWPRSVSHP